jgi:DeoR/GlpR family transcriptional regulator of sugar metabolism
MLATQRQRLITEEVRRRGAVRVSELRKLLNVSDMTVRRDLEALAVAGVLEKVHGGATARALPSSDEPGFEAKSHRQLEEKEAIAIRAAALVSAGQAIALTAGTTTWRLAHHILQVPNLTVVTNSPPVADVLHREGRPDLTVVLTGGVRTPSDALVGPVAVTTLRSLHVDILFMGVHGMSADGGFTTPNLLEAETNRALVASAERVVVTADHTKWGVRGLSRMATLEDVDIVVSDGGLSPEARTTLEEADVKVVLAPAGPARAHGAAAGNGAGIEQAPAVVGDHFAQKRRRANRVR